jgi:hypothetical protein
LSPSWVISVIRTSVDGRVVQISMSYSE